MSTIRRIAEKFKEQPDFPLRVVKPETFLTWSKP
jgi:hypothetical protein